MLVRFCERLAEVYTDAWTFVVEEGVEAAHANGRMIEEINKKAVGLQFKGDDLAGKAFV